MKKYYTDFTTATIPATAAGVSCQVTIKQNFMRKMLLPDKTIAFLLVLLFVIQGLSWGQAVGDYRTQGTGGNWTTLATWQRLNTLPNTWTTPTTTQGYPGQNSIAGTVTILSGDAVSLNVSPVNNIGALVVTGTLGNNGTDYTLAITGNVSGAGTITGSTNANGHTLSFSGNWTFAGTIGGRVSPTITGTVDQTMSGTVSSFRTFTVNKASGILFLPVTPTVSTTARTILTNGSINYSGITGTQTVFDKTHPDDLILSGGGIKSFPSTTTSITGVLSLEGTVTTTGSTPTFGGAATLQYKGSAAQTTGVEFPATFSGSGGVIINNTNGVLLGGSKTISNNLTLTLGKVTLGANDLTVSGSISGASSTNYIVTNITGQLNQVVTTAKSFPVGNAAYNPVTLTNTGTSDTYGVNVLDGSYTCNNNTKIVTERWQITEAVGGGSNLAVVAQYNTGQTAANYASGTTPYMGFYDGTSWSEKGATIGGAGPFTFSSSSNFTPVDLTTGTQYFGLGKDDAFLGNGLYTGALSSTTFTVSCVAGATGTVAYSSKGITFAAGNVFTVQLSDNTGSFSSPTSVGTLTATAASGTINITIPTGTTPGTAYRIRVVSSNPANTGTNSAAFTINNPCLDFQSTGAGGNWNSIATWQMAPHGTTNWILATVTPDNTYEDIFIRSGSPVTVSAGVTVDQVTVDAGGQITVNTTITLTVANGTGTDLIVNGTSSSSGKVVNSGTITMTGTAAFNAYSAYQHARNGGTIPAVAWDASSTCSVTGMTSTTPGELGQTFGNFVWNCTSQSANATINSDVTFNGNFTLISTNNSNLVLTSSISRTLTIKGNYLQTGGIFDFNSGTNAVNTYMYIAGDFTHSAGASTITTNGNGANNGTIIFNGTIPQTLNFSNSSGAIWVNYTVIAGSTVNLTSNLLLFGDATPNFYGSMIVNGTLNVGTNTITDGTATTGASVFNLNSGAKLITSNASGVTGSIPSTNTTKTFSSLANYEFQGAATGTFTTTPTALTVNNLTINNVAGVTLSQILTSTGILALTSGVLTTNANTVIASGTVSRISGHVNGNLQKNAVNGNNLFEIGSSVYAPVTIAMSSVSGIVTLSAKVTNGNPTAGSGINPSAKCNHYWTVTKTGSGTFTNYNATFDFTNTANTGTTANYKVRKYSAGWATTTSSVTGTTITATGLTGFGDFEVGETNTITVTTQPSNSAICAGSNTTFTSASTSTPTPTVKWQRDAGSGFVDITANLDAGTTYSNFTTATLTLTGSTVSLNGYLYQAVFTNINGSATSNTATLTVNSVPTSVSATASPNPVCAGNTLTLTGGATGAINWSWTGPNSYTSTTQSPTITNITAAGAGVYNLTATNGCGSATAVSTSSVVVNPLVSPAGPITGLTTVVEGSTSIPYSVGTIANALTYTWTTTGTSWIIAGSGTSITINFNVGATTGQLHVKGVNGCGDGIDSYITITVTGSGGPCTASTWTGAINNNWSNPANWSDCVPGVTTDVTIPVMATTYPVISSTAYCNNLIIASGASILDNGYLTITSGANVTVARSITGGEWHLISSPVSGAVSGMFQGLYLQTHSEPNKNYTDITALTDPLVTMKGYALYRTGNVTSQFVGGLNTGNMGADNNLTRSGIDDPDPLIDEYGWNLVGNPYPSYIDWLASGWTKTNVSNAIYIHVNSATWATFIAGAGANGGSQFIAPCQGFFVHVPDAGSPYPKYGSLKMTNSVRTNSSASFFKSTVPDLVRLQLSGNGYNDEAVVRFLSDAGAGFDGEYDALKLFGDVPEAAQLYTIGGNALSINTLPETNLVNVGMRGGVSGTYTIAATEINDLKYVTLEDTKTGIFTELAKNAYSFNFTAGENEMRFKLHFSALGIDDKLSTTATIYSYQQTVYINLNENIKGDIFVYNIAGQLVTSKFSASGMNEIKVSNTGNYIVKVISKESSLVRKVFIN